MIVPKTKPEAGNHRSACDPRARYLVREIDPSDLTEIQVSGASTWHEYVNGSIFHDLSFNGQGTFDVDRTYCD